MDNQGTSFNTFGIQQASVIAGDTADLIFGGGSPVTDASTASPLKKKEIKPLEEPEEKEILEHTESFSADDLFKAITPKEDDDQEPIIEPIPTSELDNKEPQEDDVFGNMTKELIKMGIFKERDEDSTSPVKTGQGLKERFEQESEDKANEKVYNFLMSKHGQEGVDAFDAIFVKGVPVNDYLSKFDQLKTFEGLDLTQEENQKKVYREAFRRQGMAEDKIERKLQKSIDYGDLEEEVTDLHEILIKQEREDLNLQVEESARQEEIKRQQKSTYQSAVQQILTEKLKNKEFDGIPLTDKLVRESYDYLTTEKWVLPSGEKLTDFDKDVLELRDPKNHEQKVKMALLLRNKLDLSKVKAKAITAESNELFETLVKRNTQQKRTQKLSPVGGFFDNLK